MEEIENNPQVYTTQEGIVEIKGNPQVYTTQEGRVEIKNNPQVCTTRKGIGEIKNKPSGRKRKIEFTLVNIRRPFFTWTPSFD